MSLFSESVVRIETPTVAALLVPLAIGAAIALADTAIGHFTSTSARVPVGLITGGAIALGGAVGWFWRRARARGAVKAAP
jgi:hypothetical protein